MTKMTKWTKISRNRQNDQNFQNSFFRSVTSIQSKSSKIGKMIKMTKMTKRIKILKNRQNDPNLEKSPKFPKFNFRSVSSIQSDRKPHLVSNWNLKAIQFRSMSSQSIDSIRFTIRSRFFLLQQQCHKMLKKKKLRRIHESMRTGPCTYSAPQWKIKERSSTCSSPSHQLRLQFK